MSTLYDKQPEDLEPIEYTHFDCWFEDTTINPTRATSEELTHASNKVLDAWENTLKITLNRDNLDFSTWENVYNAFDNIVEQVLKNGYNVYNSEDNGFIEIYESKPIHKEIVSYALEIKWSDGTKEIRRDFPIIPYIDEYLDGLERAENE
jgi:hypothetical protein